MDGARSILEALVTSDDGRYALSTGRDQLFLWDVGTGTILRSFCGHSGQILCAGFVPGGAWVASSGEDRTVRLWNIETGNEDLQLREFAAPVDSFAVSADGSRLLASGGAGHSCVLFHLPDAAPLLRLVGHTEEIRSVVISPDGTFALTGGMDRTIRLWNLNTGLEVRCFRGHESPICSIWLVPGRQQFLSAGLDGAVHWWDLATGRLIKVFRTAADIAQWPLSCQRPKAGPKWSDPLAAPSLLAEDSR